MIILLCTFVVVVLIVLVRSFTFMKRVRDQELDAKNEHYHWFSRRR